ncbi:7TM diverse intracellular signaling domain-containing protein [Cytophagales bacterium LB-30]|uniref:7TM diverse intracellular signaling domain-containing protein n=1 Tax=Shiella aurantiaca TaxID=3058365 RepID=A0ABT8F6L4_9BACT|nr:7TM diverse intracellular signaling domain-containing protein [Shiella aurantiaca]MDN4166013.1 7TM diverse intracellular signaling domain-containing protein [Shiella aurantiaca]
MKRSLRYFLLFALLVFTEISYGQFALLEDSTLMFSPREALRAFRSGEGFTLEGERFNPGFTRSVYWLYYVAPDSDSTDFVRIGNAHVNRIEFYSVSSDSLSPPFLTGDHLPFRQRPVLSHQFVFPLKAQAKEYLWRIDKHNESLQLPVKTLTFNEWSALSAADTLANGALTGVLILIVLLGGFLFYLSKERLYLYYIFYLSMAVLWIWADKGYGFQYLWSDSPYFATRARPFFYALSCAGLLLFMREFIGQSKASPYYRWINILSVVFTLLAFTALLKVFTSNAEIGGKMLYVYLLIVTPSGLLALVLLGLSLAEKIREGSLLAKYYLVSVSVYILFGGLEIISHSGVGLVSNYYLSNFGMQTGLLIEAVILLYGLAVRFHNYRQEKEVLQVAIHQKQQEVVQQVFEAQEKERKSIADQLHDEVGSMLSVVNLSLSSIQEKQAKWPSEETHTLGQAREVLQQAADMVRNLSHVLTPIAIEKYGFARAVENLVNSINASGKIKIELTLIGFEQVDAYSGLLWNDVYRCLQELLNNVIKHSGASHAYVEVIEHEDAINLMVEDNGRGFASDKPLGYGLQNLQSKVSFHHGVMEYQNQAAPESGVLVVIEIPLKKE